MFGHCMQVVKMYKTERIPKPDLENCSVQKQGCEMPKIGIFLHNLCFMFSISGFFYAQ